jgi:outer membrane protein assembly factor BamB
MKKITILLTLCCIFFTFCGNQPTQSAIENWYRFRGPNGQGISQSTGLPTHWSTTENVAWRTHIPGESWSSPIVWDNHIFLTTVTEEGANCYVIALNRHTGEILWSNHVFTQQANQHRHDMNSFATPTPVTDGQSVFALFADGSFVSLDFDGNIQWINREVLNWYSQHGVSASPILYNDLLIMAVDQSGRPPDRALGWHQSWDQGYVLALDKNTGEERWRTMRGMSRLAHATPAILNVNGRNQLISPAGDVIQGFDPTDGRLIWTVSAPGEPCVPSPVFGNGLVFTAATSNAPIFAVRPDGQGYVTETHVEWTTSGYSPMMSSFLFVEPYLITFPDNRVCVLNAATGEFIWQERLGIGQMNPSPIFADGKIYAISERSTTVVMRLTGDAETPLEIIATNELDDEMTRASFAVAGNRLLIRTANYLWSIGE